MEENTVNEEETYVINVYEPPSVKDQVLAGAAVTGITLLAYGLFIGAVAGVGALKDRYAEKKYQKKLLQAKLEETKNQEEE